jgi:hypothetical protein
MQFSLGLFWWQQEDNESLELGIRIPGAIKYIADLCEGRLLKQKFSE